MSSAHSGYERFLLVLRTPFQVRAYSHLLLGGAVFVFCFLVATGVLYIAAHASLGDVSERTKGFIVLDVEHDGEAWYVWPESGRRYYLGRPDDAFEIMRFLSLGITDADLARIPTADEERVGDAELRRTLSGKILLQTQQHGEAWYVYPGDLKRYYLGRPTDAFTLMRNLGLGITSSDLAAIPISTDPANAGAEGVDVQQYTLVLSRGSFPVKVVTIGRGSHTVVTDVAAASDCDDHCPTFSLADVVRTHGAEAGIHGTYFCPPDYSACQGKVNSFNPPFYDTRSGVMIQEDVLPFHAGPLVAVGEDGSFRYYHRSIDFGYSVTEFEQREGVQLQAAISNYPSLVEEGAVIVESEPVEASQETKALRGAFGYDEKRVYLVTASSASVRDMAYIMQAIGADWALNLDGGGSTALYANGGYLAGPGRLLPNAIVLTPR